MLFKFKDGTTDAQIGEVVDAFRALKQKIDLIQDFEYGTDVSVENKSQGFTHCFFVTFNDEKARDAYLPHPAHKEFGTLCATRFWTRCWSWIIGPGTEAPGPNARSHSRCNRHVGRRSPAAPCGGEQKLGAIFARVELIVAHGFLAAGSHVAPTNAGKRRLTRFTGTDSLPWFAPGD